MSTRLRRYFQGDVEAIDGVSVDMGGTVLQRRVWATLRGIPAGTTVTYGDLARAVGRPNAARAIGMINGQNPVAIVVPCHRVVGADASPTGYAGGLWRKRWLLHHEGAVGPWAAGA
jgi:methylated-DNA-[protein]-cysteine S-methyltransferase